MSDNVSLGMAIDILVRHANSMQTTVISVMQENCAIGWLFLCPESWSEEVGVVNSMLSVRLSIHLSAHLKSMYSPPAAGSLKREKVTPTPTVPKNVGSYSFPPTKVINKYYLRCAFSFFTFWFTIYRNRLQNGQWVCRWNPSLKESKQNCSLSQHWLSPIPQAGHSLHRSQCK